MAAVHLPAIGEVLAEATVGAVFRAAEAASMAVAPAVTGNSDFGFESSSLD